MATKLQLEIAGQIFQAELNGSETAQQIIAALPFEAAMTRWGDEFYFGIPPQLDEAADAVSEVPVGALAYWPPGNAFCIFFGPTPVSHGQEPRAYSPVNIFGRLLDDVAPLRDISNGARIKVTLAK